MATTTVSSGQTVSNVTISSGDTEIVLSGGSSVDPQVAGGSLELQGGSAISAFLVSNGQMDVSAGGSASGTNVSDGFLQVLSGGTVSGTTISGQIFSAVQMDVDGGTAYDTQVVSGGQVTVESGGLTVSTSLAGSSFRFNSLTNFSTEFVSAGGTASATTIRALGYLEVDSSGTAVAADISSGGSAVIFSRGETSGATIESGGHLLVLGNAIDTQILAGGMMEIAQYATLYGDTEHPRSISGSGTATSTTVSSGGFLDINSTASGLFILSGGSAVGGPPCDIRHAIVENGGKFEISGQGIVNNLAVNSGGTFIDDMAVVSHATISSGGIFVYEGGELSGVTLLPGAREYYLDVLSGITVSGGAISGHYTQSVALGGETIDFTFSGSSTQIVGIEKYSNQGSSAVTIGIVLKAESTQDVGSGGIASGTDIGSGAVQNIGIMGYYYYPRPGGSVTNTTVEAGGIQNNYGVASGTIVRGTQYDHYIALGTTIESGGTQVVVGIFRVDAGNPQLVSDGLASNTTINSGGVEIVSRGGIAFNTTVSSGGTLIDSGGTISNLTVLSGGIFIDSAGATIVRGGHSVSVASGQTTSIEVVRKGGSLTVLSGGTASNTFISGGVEIVEAGGSAVDTTVSSGGMFVYSGGTVSNLNILPGGRELNLLVSGATVSGGTISGHYTEHVESGGKTVDVTFSGDSTQALGGIAIGTVLEGESTQNVQPRGRASGTVIGSYAVQNVDVGTNKALVGVATDTTIKAGGVQNDYAIASTTFVRGTQFIGDGGHAFDTTIERGGQQTVYKGSSSDTTIEAGGSQTVDSGGTALGTTLDSGGELVMFGGTVQGLIAQSGGLIEFDGKATVTDSQKADIAFEMSGFAAKDTLDLGGYKFSKVENLTFKENAAKTQGTLTVTDGALQAKLTLFGNYVAGGFHMAGAGAGTAITYAHSGASAPAIAVHS